MGKNDIETRSEITLKNCSWKHNKVCPFCSFQYLCHKILITANISPVILNISTVLIERILVIILSVLFGLLSTKIKPKTRVVYNFTQLLVFSFVLLAGHVGGGGGGCQTNFLSIQYDVDIWQMSPENSSTLSALSPRQCGGDFADDIFKRIFFN